MRKGQMASRGDEVKGGPRVGHAPLRRREPGRSAAAARMAGVVITTVVIVVDRPAGAGRAEPPP